MAALQQSGRLTCFSQIRLLVSYAYVHGLLAGFRNHPRRQAAIHFCLILVSIAFPPITPKGAMQRETAADSTREILLLLLKTVDLPFIVISSSEPLIQHWLFSASKGASPYRLYAASNFGSLLGLLSYPFLFEPLYELRQQTQRGLAHISSMVFVRHCAPGASSRISRQQKHLLRVRAPLLRQPFRTVFDGESLPHTVQSCD
jgi:hypothetical protein